MIYIIYYIIYEQYNWQLTSQLLITEKIDYRITDYRITDYRIIDYRIIDHRIIDHRIIDYSDTKIENKVIR